MAQHTGQRGQSDLWAGGILLAAFTAMLGIQALGLPLEVDHYKFWTRLVTENGLHQSYSGIFPHTYAIYPPVTLYFYWIIGHIYQAFVDPSFQMDSALASQTLTLLIKLPAMLFHLATAALVYWWLRGHRLALLAMAAYAFNPGAIFDIAIWGQPDSVHSFFVALTIVCLISGRYIPAGAAFALAALTKPQVWILAPLLLWYLACRAGWSWRGMRQMALAGVAGIGVSLAICSPYILSGTWRDLIRLPRQIATVAPMVSANAHNLWWVLVQYHASAIPDSTTYRFGLTYAEISAALVALSLVFTLWRLAGRPVERSLPAMAAFQSFAFFMLVTKAHENHAFMVLPLLSLVWVQRPALAGLFLGVSLTLLANTVLHDPSLMPILGNGWEAYENRYAQMANAFANTLLLVVWVGILLWTRRRPARWDEADARPAGCVAASERSGSLTS